MKTLTRFLAPSHYLQLVKNVWTKERRKRSVDQGKEFLELVTDPAVTFPMCLGFYFLGGFQGAGVYLLILSFMYLIDLAIRKKKL